MVFVWALLLTAGQPALAGSTTSALDLSTVDRKIQGWMEAGDYDGAAVAIVRHGAVIFNRCYGNQRVSTPLYVASAGKWVAAATIAAVVDSGKLSWDDKVSKWLPEFTGPTGQATLRQLLSHTAGFLPYQPAAAHVDDYQTLQEAVAHIVPLEAGSTPGSVFQYGGLSMQVAGRMAELATGKDWETLFQETIARPLRMKSTHFTPVDRLPRHTPMLAGGMRTTLPDYMHFLEMIFHGGVFRGRTILSAAAVREMQADQTGQATVQPGEYVERVRASSHTGIYGLGEWREDVDERGEATLLSSAASTGAYPWIDKASGVYGFFLAHVNLEKERKERISPFYSSPVLALLVRDAVKDAETAGVKRGYIEVEDHGRLFYEEAGSGAPVIFIHGHSFDHYEWDPQFSAMRKNFRVIRYDVRGYGRSSMPREFSSTLHARDTIALMDALKIRKAHIVGLSMGGMIATDLLALYPDRLLSVTAASGDVYGGSPGPDVPWNDNTISKRRDEIRQFQQKGIFEYKQEWLNALTIRQGKLLENLRKPVWQMIYRWDGWQPLHVEPRYLLGLSVVDKLKQQSVAVPVLVLTGDVDAGRKDRLMQLVPSARQAIIKNAGHVSNLENPEGFTEVVTDFIRHLPK